jgi:uncharacterized membrane protein (UPF0127 family)
MTSVTAPGFGSSPATAFTHSIDVLYLNDGLKVVAIQPDVRPWRFTPLLRGAASVLELPCGTAAETKTAVGDTIEITLPKDCTQLPT